MTCHEIFISPANLSARRANAIRFSSLFRGRMRMRVFHGALGCTLQFNIAIYRSMRISFNRGKSHLRLSYSTSSVVAGAKEGGEGKRISPRNCIFYFRKVERDEAEIFADGKLWKSTTEILSETKACFGMKREMLRQRLQREKNFLIGERAALVAFGY